MLCHKEIDRNSNKESEHDTMRTVVVDGPRSIRVDTRPDPVLPGPDGAIVEVSAAGICGSDLHFYEADFPMPDLALGCLMKPFTAEDIHRSLAAAEDIMRGREALRPKMPVNLMLYDKVEEEGAERQPGFIPSKRSLKTRIEHRIAGTQH